MLLKEVGHSEVGAEDYSTALKYLGHDAKGIGVIQLSNANALDVDARPKRRSWNSPRAFLQG